MSERSIDTGTARGRRRFDPVSFFETAAKGRTILRHRKREILFSQGDDANAVFYIKKVLHRGTPTRRARNLVS
jgi:CRP/FNR family cyclic AMP-dependent transcriptional regulator